MPHRFVGHRAPFLLAAPLEWALSMVLILSGLRFMVQPDSRPSSIAAMEWPWSLLFHVMVLLAGVLIAIGLVQGKHRWSHGAESVGFFLAAVVYLTYFVGLLGQSYPGSTFSMLTNLAIAGAVLLKCRALQIEARNRLKLIQQLPVPNTRGTGPDDG